MSRTVGQVFPHRIVICVMMLVSLVASVNAQTDNIVEIVVIHTADEHGWIEPYVPNGSFIEGGADAIYQSWIDNEGYNPDDERFIVVSGGDNWTGPALSTWFEGAPMVELMNAMGYDASTIGNHEFDFGRDVLAERMSDASFPYVSANIAYTDTREPVEFVDPYTIIDADGVQVGIIGLTTIDTPQTTHPRNVGDLIFTAYIDALEQYVPEMRAAGADIVLVTTHVCIEPLSEIARTLTVQIDAMFAGHCNQLWERTVNGIPILSGGWAWRSYARLSLQYDRQANQVIAADTDLVDVRLADMTSNEQLSSIIGTWQEQVATELDTEIATLSTYMRRGSWLQANWVVDAWLWSDPSADIAMTNWGGFRQDITRGSVTVGDIVGVLPFENRIIAVEITGAELIENLRRSGGAVGGIRYEIFINGQQIRDIQGRLPESAEIIVEFLDGREFDISETYRVLINDFMYASGDDYLFGKQDPNGYDTGINWRQPVIDWTREMSADGAALNTLIDSIPRGPAPF